MPDPIPVPVRIPRPVMYKTVAPKVWGSSILLERRLQVVADRVTNAAKIAAQKAVAHIAFPTRYPLSSDRNSLEQVFYRRLQEVPRRKRNRAVSQLMRYVNAEPNIRKHLYGKLSGIDLRSQASVEEQLRPIAAARRDVYDTSHGRLASVLKRINSNIQAQISTPFYTKKGEIKAFTDTTFDTPPLETKKLKFQINSIKCIEETDGFFLDPSAGADEIRLGGSKVDALGQVSRVLNVVSSDFNTGTFKSYSPPKEFTTFDLTQGDSPDIAVWPKSFAAILVLAEKDNGGLASFLHELVDRLKVQIILELANIGIVVGEAIAAAMGAAVAAAIAAAVVFVVVVLVWAIIEAFEDDIFPPFPQAITVGSFTDRWNGNPESPEGFAFFDAHGGRYMIKYSWKFVQ